MNKLLLHRLALAVISSCSLPWVALAEPQINRISPPACRLGEVTTLTITGADLASQPRLVSSLPIAQQEVMPNPKANQVTLKVTIAPDAVPGIYAVRVATESGVSNPVLVSVDQLPLQPLNGEVTNLPMALVGELNGGEVKRGRFTGSKGQRLVVDVEARRLGANFKPVLRLLDARGRQMAFAAGQPWHGGDARLATILPADGAYEIELHDQLYRAGQPNIFKLKLGELRLADRVHPAAVTAGQTAKLQMVSSSLTAETSVPFNAAGLLPGTAPLVWPAGFQACGTRPSVIISSHAELVQNSKPGEVQELPAAPVGVSGVLLSSNEDKYLIAVTPGQKLRVELQAQRLGSPLDGVLTLRNEQGQQLAQADDSPGSADPAIAEFAVPTGMNKLMVTVQDLVRRSGPEFNYRLVIREAAAPDFTLSLSSDRWQIPAGGTQVVPVQVVRRNYNGPIRLEFPGLPSFIQVGGQEIGAGANVGLVSLSSTSNESLTSGLTMLVGRGAGAQGEIVRLAEGPEYPGAAAVPYVRTEIAWGVTKPLPIQIAWSPAGEKLLQGQPLAGKVNITRGANGTGKVRLRLVSTQPTIKKKVKKNNQDVEVDDLERLLRLEPEVILPSDQSEAAAHVFVPGDLAIVPWDLAIAADLLSADGKQVVATAHTPIRRFAVESSLALELTSTPAAEGIAGVGTAGKFVGKVVRTPGYLRPVVVTLQGLPMGYAAPVEEVPADKSEFELALQFPFNNKPVELKNVKLIAVADKNNAAAARSNAVNVSVTIKQGEKPPAEKPQELFEEDAAFLTHLSEGKGQATLDTDKQRGEKGLRITPDQRYNSNIPGFAFKIRENPGPGEFRYLRYAWKKKGGNTICLQLAHDGLFGPGGSGREGAKFRYHAGPGGEQFGGSLSVAPTLPPNYEIVTRDLFADFGEFTLTGLGLSPVDGQAALFDSIYLGKSLEDFELLGN